MQAKIDCHVHVFDPARFPYPEDNFYKPAGAEIGTAGLLGQVLDAHGVRHALIVGPNSGYGFDNRCLLDALAQGAGRYKGVAVVRNDASLAELQELQAAGVVGVTLNVALLGVDHYRDVGPLLERLRQLDMWAQVQVQFDELVALRPLLVDSGVRLLFDHLGRPIHRRAWSRLVFRPCWAWPKPAARWSSCPVWSRAPGCRSRIAMPGRSCRPCCRPIRHRR